jgi:hypothetical protein
MVFTGEPLAQGGMLIEAIVEAAWPNPPITRAKVAANMDRLSTDEWRLLCMIMTGMAVIAPPKLMQVPKSSLRPD